VAHCKALYWRLLPTDPCTVVAALYVLVNSTSQWYQGTPWSREDDSHSAAEAILSHLWCQNVGYRAHKSLPLIPILSQMNPDHISPPCFLKNHPPMYASDLNMNMW